MAAAEIEGVIPSGSDTAKFVRISHIRVAAIAVLVILLFAGVISSQLREAALMQLGNSTRVLPEVNWLTAPRQGLVGHPALTEEVAWWSS